MATVKILIKGYVSGEENSNSCPTISLIQDRDSDGNTINMVVDPGILKDRELLIDALEKEGLTIDDINYVCITHSHMDHYRNIGMFPNAKAMDYWGIWEKDAVSNWNEKFTDNIEIVKTPGHNYDAITLLVKTDKGIVAIVGDVFWEKDSPQDDPYASDNEKLKKSRELVLQRADFIIPGHGDIYEVNN